MVKYYGEQDIMGKSETWKRGGPLRGDVVVQRGKGKEEEKRGSGFGGQS